MAAAAAVLKQAAALTARTVHIKTYPPVRSLAERREVLRVLSKFGDVEMFRSLKYDSGVTDAFLGVYEHPASSHEAVDASPVRYSVVVEEDGPGREVVDGSSKAAAPNAHVQPGPTQLDVVEAETEIQSPPQVGTETAAEKTKREEKKAARAAERAATRELASKTKFYELRISPSTYDHGANTALSPLHGPFNPVSLRRSAIAADLAQRIPNGISKPGLCDWATDAVAAGREGQRGKGGDKGHALTDWGRVGREARAAPWRILDRERERRNREVEGAMRGLRRG